MILIRRSDIYDKIVTIKVGTCETALDTFCVHKKLIENVSTYFKTVFNNGFLETDTQAVTLVSEEDACGFPIFMRWLYSGNFEPPTIENDDREEQIELETLCKIFVFADKRGVTTFQRLAINAIINKLGEMWKLPRLDLAEYAYQNTLRPSMLREVFTTFFGRCAGRRALKGAHYERWYDIGPRNFDLVMDFMVMIMDRARGGQKITKKEWKALTYKDFLAEEQGSPK